jgi:hypothetical protein
MTLNSWGHSCPQFYFVMPCPFCIYSLSSWWAMALDSCRYGIEPALSGLEGESSRPSGREQEVVNRSALEAGLGPLGGGRPVLGCLRAGVARPKAGPGAEGPQLDRI